MQPEQDEGLYFYFIPPLNYDLYLNVDQFGTWSSSIDTTLSSRGELISDSEMGGVE